MANNIFRSGGAVQRRGHLRALPGLRVDGEMANIAKIIVKPLQVHVCSVLQVCMLQGVQNDVIRLSQDPDTVIASCVAQCSQDNNRYLTSANPC